MKYKGHNALKLSKGCIFARLNQIKMEFLYTLAIIFGFFGIAFLMINLRQLITGKEFRGTCSSNNTLLKNELGDCTVCGKKADEACKMPEVEARKA